MPTVKSDGLRGLSLRARGLLLTIRARTVEKAMGADPASDPCIDGQELAAGLVELATAGLIDPRSNLPTPDGWDIGTETWTLDPGYVYAVWRSHDGAIKIGKSRKPKGRFSGIKGMGLSCDFKLLGYGFYRNMSAQECRLHHVFATHRLDGEWFAVSWDAIKEHLVRSESFTDFGGVACQTA